MGERKCWYWKKIIINQQQSINLENNQHKICIAYRHAEKYKYFII